LKSILYYTDNQCRADIADACIKQIEASRNGHLVVSVSQRPVDFGTNIVMDIGSSQLSMFRQILEGLRAIETDIIFFAEHDCLYPPGHFDFMPPEKDVYYFNTNVWSVRSDTGETLHYDGMKKTSGLVAYRGILLEHYAEKVALIEREGFSQKKHGYEPGKKNSKGRPNDYEWECFESEHPYIDIKHDNNLTKRRWSIRQYRKREERLKSWVKSDRVPYWGKTKPFNDFLKAL
jgi:hypothetical protein